MRNIHACFLLAIGNANEIARVLEVCSDRERPIKRTAAETLGGTVADQNCMHEEIKSRLNLGDACSHSVENIRLERQVII
jgi:hypothetical protein